MANKFINKFCLGDPYNLLGKLKGNNPYHLLRNQRQYMTAKNHENHENVWRTVVTFEPGLLGLQLEPLEPLSHTVLPLVRMGNFFQHKKETIHSKLTDTCRLASALETCLKRINNCIIRYRNSITSSTSRIYNLSL